MWDLNDLNAPESEAVQSEREIAEDIARAEQLRVEARQLQAHPYAGDPGDGDRVDQELQDIEARLCPNLHDTLQAAAVRQAERDTAEYVERRDGVDTGLVRFKRLRNNAWGIIGPSALLREGVDVAVTKRDGTATMATVSRVIWSGDGKAICSIRRA